MTRYISLVIAGEEYAIPLGRVHELAAEAGITPLPSTPSWVLGLLSLHGAAVPVLDLQQRFRGTGGADGRRRSVVVLRLPIRGKSRLVGIAIDALGRVLQVGDDELQPPPELEAVISLEFLAGVVEREGRFVLCLDVDRLLRAEEEEAVAALADEEAAPRPAAAPRAERLALLCVRVAGERLAVPLSSLDEIAPCGAVARIPGAAPWVLGATNVRGTIVPVVDLGLRYGLRRAEPADGATLLLARPEGGQPVGARVDAVEGLVHLSADQVDATPPFGARFPGEVVQAMAAVAGAFLPILDLHRALAEER